MGAVVPLRQTTTRAITITESIDAFFATADLAESTVAVYEATLADLAEDVGPDVELAKLDKAAIRKHLAGRHSEATSATYNRNLATIASLLTWCVENDLIAVSPIKGIRRRKPRTTVETERQRRPIGYDDLTNIWTRQEHSLRDRLFWVMAYDTAARADELLGLNIENIDTKNREGIIIGKGGSAERIYWTSATARLLPRLVNGRTTGPLFIGDRKPRSHLAPAETDLCPTTGRARLSYRRAAELWKAASNGKTLHQLRHSALTHLAEAGEDVTMIKAKSRHKSLRSLERYVNPSPAAIKTMTNKHDKNRRG